MLDLKPRRRQVLRETLRELANLFAGAMVVGQFVGDQPLSSWVLIGGVAMWAILVGLALVLAGGK